MEDPSSPHDDAFDAATAYVGSGKVNASESDLLKFYGFYKQATEGPCTVPRPGFFDVKGRAKWDAWKAVGDMSQTAARQDYIALLSVLAPDWEASGGGQKGGGGGVGGVFSSLAHDDAGEDEDVEGGTPLMAAARQGDSAAVRRLLGEGADPEERDGEGCTALHWAADKGRVEVIKELLAAGAEVDARDADGLTPLHYACIANQRGAAIGLLFGGADAAAVNEEGQTPEEVAPPAWAETVFRKQGLF